MNNSSVKSNLVTEYRRTFDFFRKKQR